MVRVIRVRLSGRKSSIKARMPPSPLLSSRRIQPWYLMPTTRTRVQKIKESTPSTFAGCSGTAWLPAKHTRSA